MIVLFSNTGTFLTYLELLILPRSSFRQKQPDPYGSGLGPGYCSKLIIFCFAADGGDNIRDPDSGNDDDEEMPADDVPVPGPRGDNDAQEPGQHLDGPLAQDQQPLPGPQAPPAPAVDGDDAAALVIFFCFCMLDK